MTGYINASLEAVIPLRLFGGGMAFREVEAVIDTGFNGALALPPDMIESLSLPLHQPKRFVLGDGSERSLKQYYAEMA